MNDKVIVRAPKIYKEILSGRGGGVRRWGSRTKNIYRLDKPSLCLYLFLPSIIKFLWIEDNRIKRTIEKQMFFF